MRLIFSPSTLLCVLSLCVIPAYASSVSINGTCETGSCNSQDILSLNSSTSSPFDVVYTFANSDRYEASGTVGASATSTELSITAANITLTYLGNSTDTASANDVFSIDFIQYFQDGYSRGTNNSGYEYLAGNFSGDYADASSVSGQADSNGGVNMQLLGPFYPPTDFSASATDQPFSYAAITQLDFLDTVTFGSGSGVGATISVTNIPENPPVSPVPEPSTWIEVGTCLLCLLGSRLADSLRSAGRVGRVNQPIQG